MSIREFNANISRVLTRVEAGEALPEALASLNLDLALAPLESNSFNEAKSHLKLIEYGILGFPVICSDVTAYRGDFPVTRLANSPKALEGFLGLYGAAAGFAHGGKEFEQAGVVLVDRNVERPAAGLHLICPAFESFWSLTFERMLVFNRLQHCLNRFFILLAG